MSGSITRARQPTPPFRIAAACGLLVSAMHMVGGGLAHAQASSPVAWATFVAQPDTHPNIPNVMHVGYRSGGVDLPSGAGMGLINVAAPPYSATGDGVADDTAAIQAALDAAGGIAPSFTNGVIVFVPNGTYRLTGPVFIRSDDTMLLGQSEAGTVLRFEESLESGYAVFRTGGKSTWSGTGGMLWFTGPNRDGPLIGVPDISDINDGWRRTSPQGHVEGAASRGERTLALSNATSFASGQPVLIEVDNADDRSTLRHLLGDGVWASNYDFDPVADARVLPDRQASFAAMATVESVSTGLLTLREPLRFDLRSEWNPRVSSLGDLRRNVGVSRLTIHLDRDYEWTRSLHNLEPGFNGIFFGDTVDGFVSDVTILNAGGLAVMASFSANITVSGLTVDSTESWLHRHHHAFVISRAFNCLFEDFDIRSRPLHGIYLGGFSMGNVYSRGTMAHGAFDYHKGLPYENVITEVTINNDGSPGGGADGGPRFGARHAHWNISTGFSGGRLISQPDLMPRGALVGVRCATPTRAVHPLWGDPECVQELVGPGAPTPNPPNLYEAQLALRDGLPIPGPSNQPPCPQCGSEYRYDFNFSGTLGQNMVGQDSWEMGSDLSAIDGDNVSLVALGDHPETTSFAVSSRPGRDSIISRPNDARYCSPPFFETETRAMARFDASVGELGGANGNAYFILTNSDGFSEGIQFGMSDKEFLIRGDRFGTLPQQSIDIPDGWYTRGEWARVLLIIDFEADSGRGEASLSFMNLSRGELTPRAAPGMQNVPLEGSVRYPESWDRLELRLRRSARATNLVANIGSTCVPDFDGNGVIEGGDLTQLLTAVGAGSSSADVSLDGLTDAVDVAVFLDELALGCGP
ncbi:MAG: glycosyl hydrolase family 28-related protein [Planctomycetota bacterium]